MTTKKFGAMPRSKSNAVHLKASPEWFAWLTSFAASRSVTRQGLICEALRDHASRLEHPAPPVRESGRIGGD